ARAGGGGAGAEGRPRARSAQPMGVRGHGRGAAGGAAAREHRTGSRYQLLVLVTGIGGFAGRPVAEALVAGGHAVEGILRPPVERSRLVGLSVPPHALDLLDRDGLRALVAARRPDAVVHLAGLSFPPEAER